ncbi:MAG: glycerophosphodiester phosphodiesterase [Firmicutes bacterium]|nr:glycerophosphodiester phosphodiesterase [Bacillota bacterium]
MHDISVTAHAGALRTRPNTLPSVLAALACGADILELDVRFLPDGTPALGHNQVDSRSPALEAAFGLMQNHATRVNLDMKETSHAARVAELVVQYGLQGRAFLTGIEEKHVPAVRDCGLPYYLNSPDIAAALELGALGPNIHYSNCTEALVKAAHARGLLVSVWTADRRAVMREMLRMGVDNITTRRPDVLRKVMRHAS